MVSGRDAVAVTCRSASLAIWMPIEPTPPAPPMMRIDLPFCTFMRSKKLSQAVIAVSGMAAAWAKSSFFGLRPHDALVDKVELAVAAGARDVAGVVHGVTRLEEGDLRSGCLDGARRVPAQHARRGAARLALLGIDGVHGNGLDFHEKVMPRRGGARQLDVVERREVGAGMRDGFHRCSRSSDGCEMVASAFHSAGPGCSPPW